MRKDLSLSSRFAWAIVLATFSFFTSTAVAQPPGIDGTRWTGGTALTPPQGYSQGSPLTLTWGFMAPGTFINDQGSGGSPSANNTLQTRLNAIYGSQATWQPLFQIVFDRWGAVSGLTYQFEANDDGAQINANTGDPPGVIGVRADVRIGGKPIDGNGNSLAYNFFPNSGEMVIDTVDNSFNDTTGNSILLRNAVAHEHGHGLGMFHVGFVGASKILMEPFIDTSFDGPQHHDILVAQRGYGDVREKSNAGQGNDIFSRATPLGLITSSATTSIGNSAKVLAVAPTAVDFVSIDAGTDTDFYSFSIASTAQVNILLEALGFSYDTGVGTFNSEQRSNLTLALFDTNGTTMLDSSNVTGLGGDESISRLLNPGTYFVRVTGVDNADGSNLDTQFYGLSLSLTAVPEPTTWALMIGGALGTGVGFRRWLRRRKLLLDTEVEPEIVE